SGAGRTSDGNGSHASTLKSPSYTKSVSWQHYLFCDSVTNESTRKAFSRKSLDAIDIFTFFAIVRINSTGTSDGTFISSAMKITQ
ncbi:hypothetical protein, partial [Kluyvera sichuanensis]|uniref:hypothetical protein n=1 Tax=Kluyvera sichuanensis TaxID=2725494 RepID=UPI001CC428EC